MTDSKPHFTDFEVDFPVAKTPPNERTPENQETPIEERRKAARERALRRDREREEEKTRQYMERIILSRLTSKDENYPHPDLYNEAVSWLSEHPFKGMPIPRPNNLRTSPIIFDSEYLKLPGAKGLPPPPPHFGGKKSKKSKKSKKQRKTRKKSKK